MRVALCVSLGEGGGSRVDGACRGLRHEELVAECLGAHVGKGQLQELGTEGKW